jgi:hypothetical protein
MPFSTTALNQALDALAGGTPSTIIAFASLHTAYSATGTNELTGGSPAYARKAITFSAASGGSKASSTQPVFDVPPLTTVAYVGLWSLVTGGTFAGMGANGGATQFAFTCTLASPGSFTAPGSAYSVNDTVVLFPGAGATLPTGTALGTVYYIGTVTGAVFTLSTTLSNANPVNTSTTGAGIVQKITTETFNAQGTFTVSLDTLTIV